MPITKATILVVGERATGPHSVSGRLRFANCTLLKAASERQALRFFVEQDVDCVVLNDGASGLDAAQLAGVMRCMRPGIPVVIVGRSQEPN